MRACSRWRRSGCGNRIFGRVDLTFQLASERGDARPLSRRSSQREANVMAEMGAYEAMSTLRAVRRLRPDAIPDAVLLRVLEAATFAPTGGNVQPWRIVAVKNPAPKAPIGRLYNERWINYSKFIAARFQRLRRRRRGRAPSAPSKPAII